MENNSKTIYRLFAGRSVRLVSAFILGVWLLLEAGRLPEPLYAPLYPFWLPTYLAFAAASGVRNTVLPWLESGLLFDVAVLLFIYVESVLLAGLFRFLRNVYRTYRRRRETQANL